MVQIDGWEHHWFDPDHPACTLLVFIDDSTSCLMQLQFVSSESTLSYFGALESDLITHGCPVALYADKNTVFRIAKPDAIGGQGMTQAGSVLSNAVVPTSDFLDGVVSWTTPSTDLNDLQHTPFGENGRHESLAALGAVGKYIVRSSGRAP